MIPPYEAIVAAYRFLDARYHFGGALYEQGVRAALDEARSFAGQVARDEPAALFFALARRPKALGGAWRALSALVALNHVASLGLVVEANPRDLDPLFVPIAGRALDYDGVRDWFAARMRKR